MSWWPLAWSEELGEKPRAVRVADEEIVLFRDHKGAAHALEDRCPHRRVPLSLGRVTPEGTLQCGYHGWCYDGDSGRCVRIPNFRPDEPISPRVMARSYRVTERAGVLFVDAAAQAGTDAPPELSSCENAGYVRSGVASVEIEHRKWVEALLDNPAHALGLAEICKLGDVTRIEAGQDQVRIEQQVLLTGSHRWTTGVRGGDRLVSRCTTWATTGFTELTLHDAAGVQLSAIHVASVAVQDATEVRWKLSALGSDSMLARALAFSIGRQAPPSLHISLPAASSIRLHPAIQGWRSLPQPSARNPASHANH